MWRNDFRHRFSEARDQHGLPGLANPLQNRQAPCLELGDGHLFHALSKFTMVKVHGQFSSMYPPALERGFASLISRHAARNAVPQRDSLWAAAWRSSRVLVRPSRLTSACLPRPDPSRP